MRFKVISKQWDLHSDRVDRTVRDADYEFAGVIRQEARKVKLDWAAQWRPSRHLPHLGRTVTYDTKHAPGLHLAEIGPEKGGQGSIGHIIEDANGAARNRATHAGNRAGRRAESRLERAAGDAAEDGIGG